MGDLVDVSPIVCQNMFWFDFFLSADPNFSFSTITHTITWNVDCYFCHFENAAKWDSIRWHLFPVRSLILCNHLINFHGAKMLLICMYEKFCVTDWLRYIGIALYQSVAIIFYFIYYSDLENSFISNGN